MLENTAQGQVYQNHAFAQEHTKPMHVSTYGLWSLYRGKEWS